MRFSILLIALALLPLMMIAHGWFFTGQQQPRLQEAALEALRSQGIQAAVADLRYLDLRIAGNAPDPDALDRAVVAIRALGPLRLVANELTVPASLHAVTEGTRLVLTGWLPESANAQQVTQLLHKLRPDLELQSTGLKTDAHVRWPEGEGPVLTAESSLIRPLLSRLRVTPWLEIVRDETGTVARGVLPADGSRTAVLSALEGAQTQELKESLLTTPATFAEAAHLLPFLKSFFAGSSPRRFRVDEDKGPVLQATGTRSQESEWLSLLRAVSGGKKVDLELTLYPSEFHLPGRQVVSPLAPEVIQTLTQKLQEHRIRFETGSTLSAEAQAQLAALTPSLLAAGPALRLVIGGHGSPEGDPQSVRRLAKARAEAVHSFLVEQGLPATDVETLAFDPVPPGTPGAPAEIQSVEILIR